MRRLSALLFAGVCAPGQFSAKGMGKQLSRSIGNPAIKHQGVPPNYGEKTTLKIDPK
jgi:hypothetical protein